MDKTELELKIIETDHHRVMGEALNRLRDNPDFKAVITEGYLKDKVLASVSLLGVPQINEAGKRVGIMEDLISSSNLQYFFSQIDSFYEGVTDPILSDEEEAELEAERDKDGVA